MRRQMTWQRLGKQQTCLRRSLSPCSMAQCCRQPAAAIRMRRLCSQCSDDDGGKGQLPTWRWQTASRMCMLLKCAARRSVLLYVTAKLQWDCVSKVLFVGRYFL
jgi:hypothetical protein